LRKKLLAGLLLLLTALVAIENTNATNATYDDIEQINASDPIAWFYRGEALFNLSKCNESIEAYNNSLELNRSYAKAWNSKGIAFAECRSDYDEALKCFENAIGIDRNYSRAWYNKGIMLDYLNRNKEALESYNKSIQLDPNYADAWNNKGRSFCYMG
jgi:tetratricopeptide (TPR) repeat protein